jgi:predicted AAA+ superfamily ATPase
MDALFRFQNNLLPYVKDDIRRELLHPIDWSHRLVALRGLRGAGKTTLLLQHMKFDIPRKEALYVTAEHHWFYTKTLLETAEMAFSNGIRYLFIDEIHRLPHWSDELKTIHDGLPGMHVAVTASAALELYRGAADLSRRMQTYTLGSLSFREFLRFKTGERFPKYTLDEILTNHVELSATLNPDGRMLALFKDFRTYGSLPVFLEGNPQKVTWKLENILNTTLDLDIPESTGISSGNVFKLRKLLGVIAESVPFKPNVADLARKLDVARDTVYQFLDALNRAGIINMLHRNQKGTSLLQKPEKIYFENPNWMYVFNQNPNIGTVRETFVLNQLLNAGLSVTYPEHGDFDVNGVLFEVGGKEKSAAQLQQHPNGFLLVDDVNHGYLNRIPLWLIGFLS